ncbi:hypothetical protein N7532_010680 [Penicillium argentinense]|uniref:Rab-GAP TBC domain-containing protein n=1 Tax=Penicillium argentinense TaxID=1131581 RepID=A0A9W9EQ84_9EURO|nr:uncharacterized protein N7532_010680 [Penicillium argentinense]KAJ5085909.1 hypothetical protein N7532_010680 [Penicillium argentinense]
MDSSSIKQGDSSSPESSAIIESDEVSVPSAKSSQLSLKSQQIAAARAEKAAAIRRACDDHDVEALVSYATSEGGLVQDELRQKAWPIFLQCDESIQRGDLKPLKDLPRHRDEDQVQLDVNRSFVYYPNAPEDELAQKKAQLSDLIIQVLRNHPMLCYFQGYHDIVQVLLLVLGNQKAASAMANLSLFRIRDYMLPSLSPAVKHLHLIPAIIETADPALCRHLANIQPFFALAATLTLYAHDIQEYSDIARLFDFLLAREPVVAIYLFAAMILSRKKELLEIPADEPEMLHFKLSKLPCPLDLDGHISSAAQLFEDHPPESLPFGAWRQISRNSVLKASRDLYHDYTVAEAVTLFERQARQVRNEERRKEALEFAWKHRRAVGSVALAIVVGAVSIYIRKKGLDSSIWSYVGRIRIMLLG